MIARGKLVCTLKKFNGKASPVVRSKQPLNHLRIEAPPGFLLAHPAKSRRAARGPRIARLYSREAALVKIPRERRLGGESASAFWLDLPHRLLKLAGCSAGMPEERSMDI